MMEVDKAEQYVDELLSSRLSPKLYYHNYDHTRDVMQAALRIADEEGITDEQQLALLKTAALFHDCGYINVYKNHEEEGCRIASEVLPGFGYSEADIQTICRMIMFTKLPSAPESLLEKILCDADLDYLGRDDFFPLGDKLFEELKVMGMISDSANWDEIQIHFLEAHHYWTASAIKNRAPKKAKHLQELKSRFQS